MTAARHSLFHSIAHFVALRRETRAAIRTERLIGELPRHIRKDIGWPDTWTGPARHL